MESEGIVFKRTETGISSQINMTGCTPADVLSYLHTMGIAQSELTKLLLERFGRKVGGIDLMEVRKEDGN